MPEKVSLSLRERKETHLCPCTCSDARPNHLPVACQGPGLVQDSIQTQGRRQESCLLSRPSHRGDNPCHKGCWPGPPRGSECQKPSHRNPPAPATAIVLCVKAAVPACTVVWTEQSSPSHNASQASFPQGRQGRHRAQGTAGLPEATISWHSGDKVAHWLEGKWNEERVREVGKAEQASHGTRDTWVVHLLSEAVGTSSFAPG